MAHEILYTFYYYHYRHRYHFSYISIVTVISIFIVIGIVINIITISSSIIIIIIAIISILLLLYFAWQTVDGAFNVKLQNLPYVYYELATILWWKGKLFFLYTEWKCDAKNCNYSYRGREVTVSISFCQKYNKNQWIKWKRDDLNAKRRLSGSIVGAPFGVTV